MVTAANPNSLSLTSNGVQAREQTPIFTTLESFPKDVIIGQTSKEPLMLYNSVSNLSSYPISVYKFGTQNRKKTTTVPNGTGMEPELAVPVL